MKIGKYEITSGPNLQFYVVTAFFVWLSIQGDTPWPILGWIGFCIVLIPLCLLVHKLDKMGDEKMLRDFPHDPFIQEKYGKKKAL